jgi:hypothetical protein
MKTTSKVFCLFFLCIGIFSMFSAMYGATHQYYLGAVSLGVAAILAQDVKKESRNEQ